MTKGIVLLLCIWVWLVVNAFRYPWIGFVGYGTFAVLCPPWNWRWGLPALDYQKFLALSTLLGWFVAGLQRQRQTRAVNWVIAASAGYLLLAWISSFQSLNPVKSAMYMDITLKIAIMSTVGVYVMSQPKHLMIFAWGLMFAQGWNALSINQIYFQRGFINVNWFTWNYLDNNTYCISSVPVMAIVLAILMTAEKNWQRLVSGFVFILQVHQLMLLQSRGTMVGGLVLAAVGLFFMPKNRVTLSMVSVSLILGAILAGPSVIEEFNSSFEEGENRDSSADSRFKLWKAGAGIMNDYPLLGVGPWAGELKVPQYYEGGLSVSNKALHNLFFEVGTGCGVPALMCYLAIFLIPFLAHLQLWFRERRMMPRWMLMVNLSILCGVPGYWVASMFSSGALIEAPYMMMVLGATALPVYEVWKAEAAEAAAASSVETEESVQLARSN
jgi:O-antigen ligase